MVQPHYSVCLSHNSFCSVNTTLCVYALLCLLTQEMTGKRNQTTLIEPIGGVVWGQDYTAHPYTPVCSTQVRHTVSVDAHNIHVYAPFRKFTQMSAVATYHNYMSFFKECPIPISSVPISSTSGTSKSTGLTLTLQLYQKLNEIRQKTF